MPSGHYGENVFVNCPFDEQYRPIFHAVVFAIQDCGFRPRCALEASDAGQPRIQKIVGVIRDCRFGVHDISRTELDDSTELPRFNMPFELGLFLGARMYGGRQQKLKRCMILDCERYRFQRYISDIAGQDVFDHANLPDNAIVKVRDWLQGAAEGRRLPGGRAIARRYGDFSRELPEACAHRRVQVDELTFLDYTAAVDEWLRARS
jgi:hypothetical protein